MKNDILDDLVDNGAIASYVYDDVDDCGVVGRESDGRNTQRLCLTFPGGENIVIETFCSGSVESNKVQNKLSIHLGSATSPLFRVQSEHETVDIVRWCSSGPSALPRSCEQPTDPSSQRAYSDIGRT